MLQVTCGKCGTGTDYMASAGVCKACGQQLQLPSIVINRPLASRPTDQTQSGWVGPVVTFAAFGAIALIWWLLLSGPRSPSATPSKYDEQRRASMDRMLKVQVEAEAEFKRERENRERAERIENVVFPRVKPSIGP